MARSSDWPLGEGVRAPARGTQARPRRRNLPRVTWVLVAASFLSGVLLSAAGFAVGWRYEAQRGTNAETALTSANARNQALAASLAAARSAAARDRARLATASRSATAASASARAVARNAASLATELVAAGHAADSVSLGGASVGASISRLASELKTLTAYLTTTPAAQLDPGYVATQTAYLSKQLQQLQGAQSDLAAAIGQFEQGAKSLAARASALSGTK